jgi:hypothetical protein
MRTVFLHIGAEKTGSSYLQQCFSLNARSLRLAGCRYPSPQEDHERPPASAVGSGNAVGVAAFINPTLGIVHAANSYVHYLRDLGSRETEENVLLSSELMSRVDPKRLQQFSRAVRSSGFDLIVIFYVRPIMDHAVSTYLQRVKRARYVQSLTDWITSDYDCPFYDTLDTCSAVVGRQNVKVVNYQTFKKNLFMHFVTELLRIHVGRFPMEETHQVVNRSLSNIECEIMKIMNRSLTNIQAANLTDMLISFDEDPSPVVVRDDDLSAARERFGDIVSSRRDLVDFGDPITVEGTSYRIGDPPKLSPAEEKLAMMVGCLAGLTVSKARA